MEYKYMKEQIKGAEFLTDKYPNIQTHKDIYNEFVEVLKKAQAFDEIEQLYNAKDSWYSNEFIEELGYILKYYMEDK